MVLGLLNQWEIFSELYLIEFLGLLTGLGLLEMFFITRFIVVLISFERNCCFILVIYTVSVVTIVVRIFWGGVLNETRFY